MRGYNQQNNSTSSNPQDSFLTKDIEDYTIKDCEDFLAKYPKDIDADKVRKRLEQLKPKKNADTTSAPKRTKQETTSKSNNTSSKTYSSTPNNPSFSKPIKDKNGYKNQLNEFRNKVIIYTLKFLAIVAVFGGIYLLHNLTGLNATKGSFLYMIGVACCYQISKADWKL